MVARRRVGVLVPSANSTAEPDFVLAAPKHVTVHANRIGWEAKNLTEDEAIVDRMNARVEEAASPAMVWAAFRKLGVSQPIAGLGSLLEKLG